jgi:hypothetical protein
MIGLHQLSQLRILQLHILDYSIDRSNSLVKIMIMELSVKSLQNNNLDSIQLSSQQLQCAPAFFASPSSSASLSKSLAPAVFAAAAIFLVFSLDLAAVQRSSMK